MAILTTTFSARVFVLAVGLLLAGMIFAAASKLDPTTEARPVSPTFRDMRASKLIGSKVRNARRQELGEMKDLIVDVNNDRVYYVVLSVGGFLGFGDQLFAYPVRMFTQAADGDKLVLNLDKVDLNAVQGLDKKRGSDWGDHYGDIDRYFGKLGDAQPMPNQVLRRASELIGKDVKGRDAEDLGNIGDLVVNVGKGSVHYAVLEFDQPWNMNNRTVMVPLRVFNFSADGGDAFLNVDKSNLDNALTFDKNRWPNINNPLFLIDVDRYLILVDPKKYGTNSDAQTVFDRLDVNRDDKLSVGEVRRDRKVLGAWRQLDAKGTGEVTRTEFAARYNAITK